MPSKLLDKVAERESSRVRLLDFRRSLAEAIQTRDALESRIRDTLTPAIRAEVARLTELTRELCQLANADLAGILGARVGDDADTNNNHATAEAGKRIDTNAPA